MTEVIIDIDDEYRAQMYNDLQDEHGDIVNAILQQMLAPQVNEAITQLYDNPQQIEAYLQQ